MPSALFSPTMPPTFVSPVTVPSKLQFSKMPQFVPTNPPTFSALPVTFTLPETVNSFTLPVLPT